ncbi:MAG: hypothetical protein B7Y66_12335 [Sphingobacteriia bacterium 35-36-14]|nr:MAG: hypothetical protein B7Y66_12335 [Sphingobacteriia bacterium 35-36-14]OZA68648.1 MAG: hypothetical protein B7X72_01385 [Sphingobacteriia bacterium 39-39-8]
MTLIFFGTAKVGKISKIPIPNRLFLFKFYTFGGQFLLETTISPVFPHLEGQNYSLFTGFT